MKLLLAALPAALIFTACSHNGPARNPSYAVNRAMHRQTRAHQANVFSHGDLPGDALRREIAGNPDNLAARRQLALHYEQSGQPELAAEHLRFALQKFPQDIPTRTSLVRVLRQMGFDRDALDTLNATTAETWETQSWRGILLDDLGRHDDANKAHRAALDLQPNSATLHNNLGQSLLFCDKPKDAAAAFRAALTRDSRHEIARNNLGIALALSNPADAIAHWQSVSGPAAAHTNMAVVYLEQDKLSDARRELNIALGHNRNYQPALANLAIVAGRDGRPAVLEPGPVQPPTMWAKIRSKLFGR